MWVRERPSTSTEMTFVRTRSGGLFSALNRSAWLSARIDRAMNIGALPRRCRPFSLTESGSPKCRTKHNNGVRLPFFSSAHERQCEALGFMDQPFQVHMTRAPLAKYSTAWRLLISAASPLHASLPPMWRASSRTIRKLRLAIVPEARSLSYAILASKLIAKNIGSC